VGRLPQLPSPWRALRANPPSDILDPASPYHYSHFPTTPYSCDIPKRLLALFARLQLDAQRLGRIPSCAGCLDAGGCDDDSLSWLWM
jgi:hypothetical protein